MNKEELLQELSSKINSGEISREEVEGELGFNNQINQSTSPKISEKKRSHFSLTKLLYVIGAIIVIIGLIIFVNQIWDDIGAFGRIIITLGLGLIFAITGSVLLKQKPKDHVGTIFHIIGGVLIPGGAVVTLNEVNPNIQHLWALTITFGVIFAFYMLLSYIHKNAILTFFAIGNGTAFIYLLFESIVDGRFYQHGDLYAYLTMVIGASYLLLTHAFKDTYNKYLSPILYLFGTAGILGAGFSQVFGSLPWQLFYFVLVLGGIVLSIYLKSKSILVVSTLFLIFHISYITGKYFANSLGWPISLILLGFVFIGLGYASITINKKYIKENN